jgi:hypothetical protein
MKTDGEGKLETGKENLVHGRQTLRAMK